MPPESAPASVAKPPSTAAADRILEVAERLFAEKGYEAASISDIARAAGVSKANVFHHFRSKEGLYMAVLRQACRHTASTLDRAASRAVVDSRAALRDFMIHQARLLFEHAQSSRLIQRELFEHASERGQRLAEEVFAEHFSRLVALVEAGQAQGRLRTDLDAALLAFLLIGANVFFFETRAVLEHLPGVGFAGDPESFSAAAFELMARGFDARDETGES